MPNLRKNQSQLDYLWSNFAKLQRLELSNNTLTGWDEDGNKTQMQIKFTSSSAPGGGSSNDVVKFDKEEINGVLQYYIQLQDGTKFSVEAQDVSDLKLQIQSQADQLQVISDKLDVINNESLENVLRLSKEYTDSKLVNLDVTKLKEQVDNIEERLSVIEDVREETILQIVQKEINSALEWEKL